MPLLVSTSSNYSNRLGLPLSPLPPLPSSGSCAAPLPPTWSSPCAAGGP